MANRNNIRGVLTLVFIGGVYLYRNRTTLMRYLDQLGVLQSKVKVRDKIQNSQDKLAG